MKYEALNDYHDRLGRFVEHGQEFVQCIGCGQSWSVVECESELGEEYEDLENLSGEDELLCEVD